MTERASYDELVAENVVLKAQVVELVAKVESLERLLSRDSSNSSKPPSTDTAAAKRKAADKRSERAGGAGKKRKPGKQPGAKGAHLARVSVPDLVIDHIPDNCGGCGAGLAEAEILDTVVRQVFDVPPPKLVVTEHRAHKRRCGCGHVSAGVFPDHVTAPAVYGPRLGANALYLMARQHVPIGRAAEAMGDLFDARVSTGWLDALYQRAGDGLGPFIDTVTEQLRQAPVVGVDETSDRLNAGTCWFHVARTDQLTLLHADQTRAKTGADAAAVLPDHTGTLVHDRFALYWLYDTASHQLCCAHLLRNLASVAEWRWNQTWAKTMSRVLLDARDAVDAAVTADPAATSLKPRVLADIEARYDAALVTAFARNPDAGTRPGTIKREAFNLASALATHKQHVLGFTRDFGVPFDNNGAERDLRMVKLHRKISGTFRSLQGARRFAAVRSYIHTTQKHGHHIIDTLYTLTCGNPWTPPTLTPT